MSLSGALVPLTAEQRTSLKEMCGQGGLRVLALAYKDLLLEPAAAAAQGNGQHNGSNGGTSLESSESSDCGFAVAGSGGGGIGVEEVERDLVLTGLLGLEDPGGREGGEGGGAGEQEGSRRGSWGGKGGAPGLDMGAERG